MSEEDKQALAIWMLDNPRGPAYTNETYFERFIAHVSFLFSFRGPWLGSLCPVMIRITAVVGRKSRFSLCYWKFLTVVPQHMHLPPRTWNTWLNATNNHKDDIAARQRAVKKSRGRKKWGRKLSVTSVSKPSTSASSIDHLFTISCCWFMSWWSIRCKYNQNSELSSANGSDFVPE
jgi:hypothetical protein